MIRDSKSNISVSKGHGYTVEKVKFAVNFVEKAGRNTTIDEWVAAYNYIKNANETAQGCQSCKAAKFTAAVRNYARYGYLTLLNEGHSPEEFKDAASKDVERKDETDAILAERPVKTAEDELLENALESLHNVQETTENDVQEVVDKVVEEKQSAASKDGAASQSNVQRDVERTKVRRKKNVKSDDKQ